MPVNVDNLLPPSPASLGTESFAPLAEGTAFQLEHIISRGEASPDGFWYDQDRHEWVMLVRGSATLEFEDGTRALVAGDCLTIEAHCRHRVACASIDAVWLALHYDPNSQQ